MKNDAEKIYRLEKACFSKVWEYDFIKKQLLMPHTVYVLNNIGYALGISLNGECELYRIGVLPNYRGRGEGKALLSEFISECYKKNESGCRIFLEVRSRNTAAVSIYKSAGFIQIAKRPAYYDDDDALVFELTKP